jgi:hypothetical protein
MSELKPGKTLEATLRTVDRIFGKLHIPYWLSFGGLWGLVKNNGTIPDGDLDFCVHYGVDWERVISMFERFGWAKSKVMLNDTDHKHAVYFGFNKKGFPHMCVSCWFLHDGIRYYCHDQNRDLCQGTIGVPKSGYYFKGVPAIHTDGEYSFKKVEWPGISGITKVCVPVMAGAMMDYMYPCWEFRKQRYTPIDYEPQEDKMVSIWKSGAMSPYMVHVRSMDEWNDKGKIDNQLRVSRIKWDAKLKELKNK